MTQADVISRWSGTVSFAVISTARRLRIADYDKADNFGLAAPTNEKQIPWDYIEVDNRGNKGAIIFWALNGRTASSVLDATFISAFNAQLTVGANRKQSPLFRLYSDNIDRVFARCTSISVVSSVNATTIFVTVGRF